MNTQNSVKATEPGAATQRPEEAIRVPSVREHMLRVFGLKRQQSLYGVEGDQLAARYPQKKFGWVLGYDEAVPLFLEQSRLNQQKAYCCLIAIAVVGFFLISGFVRAGSRGAAAHLEPPAQLSPAEKLLMSTVQQQLGVSDKAMKAYYHPPAQQPPPERVEQPPVPEQVGAAPQPHHPQSMRTFGLRAQREQAQMQPQPMQQQYAMPSPQQQYAMPSPQQQYAMPSPQQQYGMPSPQQQPQRMQVYVAR